MVKVSTAELKAALSWLKRHWRQAKACTVEWSGGRLVLMAGDAHCGIWHARHMRANGPVPFEGCWSVSLRHLLKAVAAVDGPSLSLGMNGNHLIVGHDSAVIAELPIVITRNHGGVGTRFGPPLVGLPVMALTKVLKKSALDHLWTYLQPDSETLLVKGSAKSVQLVASNFTNRTIQAAVAGPDPARRPFQVRLRREAIGWLQKVRASEVAIAENDSLTSLALIDDGVETGLMILQKKENSLPSYSSMRVPRSHWGPACMVNTRQLKRAFIQLMAPSGGALPEAIELALEPGRLSLAATFAMGSVKARVKVPCEASFSSSVKLEYSALALALRSVCTSSLVIHVASNNRLVLRSKGLVQTVHGLA